MTDEWYVIYFVLPGNNTAPTGATFRPPGENSIQGTETPRSFGPLARAR